MLVAPPTGSVDRNIKEKYDTFKVQVSLPPWGAWIEIDFKSINRSLLAVAPPMGSVDRNALNDTSKKLVDVAPPMGSVDRNSKIQSDELGIISRSPHGERG